MLAVVESLKAFLLLALKVLLSLHSGFLSLIMNPTFV
jgi:hypothetical protein